MKPEIAIEVLTARTTWLSARMAEAEARGKILSRDRTEYLALQVALEALRKVGP